MNEQLKKQVAASKALKEEAREAVKIQRTKSLLPNSPGRPSLEEESKAIKEHIDKPLSNRKRALELFDQVVTASSEDVFKKLLRKAMDDMDKDQFAAIKLITDRLAPMAKFDDSGASGSGTGRVVINISGLANTQPVSVQGNVIDAEDGEIVG